MSEKYRPPSREPTGPSVKVNPSWTSSGSAPGATTPASSDGACAWAAMMNRMISTVVPTAARTPSLFKHRVITLTSLVQCLLLREGVGAKLEVHGHRLHPLAAFDEPRRAIAAAGPQPAALPASIRIVDASIEPLGVEALRIRYAQRDHLAVLERDQTIHEVGRRYRDILSEAERVVLVDPAVVARLGAVIAYAFEAGAGIFVKRPALRAVIAGRLRSVERTFALAPVKAANMAARERHPHDALAVDVAAARAEARLRHVIDLREGGFRRVGAGIEPHDGAG